MENKPKEKRLGQLFFTSLWRWGRRPGFLLFFFHAGRRLLLARYRHYHKQRTLKTHIPSVLALSPTMMCNYRCLGCYAQDRPTEKELTDTEIDNLLQEAGDLGFASVVITGGEPLLRKNLIPILQRHQHLLFIMISNGSLLTPDIAGKISRSKNILTLISVEGLARETDERRGKGAFQKAIQAMHNLKLAGAFYGFAATNTRENSTLLGSKRFINRMIEEGCAVGFFTEYVPCGPQPKPEWVLTIEERNTFRQQVLHFRQTTHLMLIQFPQDEYGKENLCSAAGKSSLHINSQGDVEPCPFVSVSCGTIRKGGLIEACRTPLLAAIRARPELLQRQYYACSLFEHLQEIKELAKNMQTHKN